MVNSVAVTAHLLTTLYVVANKEYLTKREMIFRYVDSLFSQLNFHFHLNWLTLLEAIQKKRVLFIFIHSVG